MSQHIINSTTLAGIGDEIRSISGTTDAMSPATMKSSLSSANAEVEEQNELLHQLREILGRKSASTPTSVYYSRGEEFGIGGRATYNLSDGSPDDSYLYTAMNTEGEDHVVLLLDNNGITKLAGSQIWDLRINSGLTITRGERQINLVNGMEVAYVTDHWVSIIKL